MVRLWINNELAEVAKGEVVATTLQVNDVEKPDTFQSSFSNTFELPLTRVNRKILGNVQAVGLGTNLRSKLPCRLEDSGQLIVSNGFLVVNEITNNAAKVTIFDGVADFFTQIGDRALNELDLTSISLNFDLSEVNNNTQNTYSDGYIWALANYGDLDSSTTIDVRYQYPSIFVKYLFEKIAEQFTEYSFVDSGFWQDSFFESLVLPFTNNDDIANGFSAVIANVTRSTPPNSFTNLKMIDYTLESLGDGVFNLSSGEADYTFNTKPLKVRAVITGNLSKSGFGAVDITTKIIGANTATVYATNTITVNSASTYSVAAETDFLFLNEPVFCALSISFSGEAGESFTITNVSFGTPILNLFNDSYLLNRSLPDMTIKDFIKSVLKMFGLVPQIDTYRKTILLKQFEVFSNESPIDYSANIDYSQLITREYQYGDYALSNDFTYLEDNQENPIFANGAFSIDNALLDDSYKWIELEFASSETEVVANDQISLASLKVLDSNLEANNNLKPRIGYIKYFNTATRPNISFTDGSSTTTNVQFSTVNFANPDDSQTLVFNSLRVYHDEFIKMLQGMEKITISLSLNATQYNNLDYFKPIYLNFTYKEVQIIGVYLLAKIEDYVAGQPLKCKLTKLNLLD